MAYQFQFNARILFSELRGIFGAFRKENFVGKRLRQALTDNDTQLLSPEATN